MDRSATVLTVGLGRATVLTVALNNRTFVALAQVRKEAMVEQLLISTSTESDLRRRALVASVDIRAPIHYKEREPRVYISQSTEKEMPIVFDTGASFSVTPILEDFVSPLAEPDVQEMTGLADKVAIKGIGWVEWNIRDMHGVVGRIRTHAYYVPEATIRLFSPQTYFQEDLTTPCEVCMNRHRLTLTSHDETDLEFPFHPCTNLPVMYVDSRLNEPTLTREIQANLKQSELIEQTMNLLDYNNHNLSKAQQELLIWHY